MADETTPTNTTVQTIVVHVTPADADPAKMDIYVATFWTIFAILLVLWGWTELRKIFDTPYDG